MELQGQQQCDFKVIGMTDQSDRPENNGLPPEFAQTMIRLGMTPEIVSCIQDAQEVLAFSLPVSDRRSFLIFHDFITNPQPRFITEWRASPREERWYIALVDGLNGTTRHAYAAVLYHFQRLSALESEVMEKISKRNYASALGNSKVAPKPWTGIGVS